jgi:uncharacterized membrane protein YgcG
MNPNQTGAVLGAAGGGVFDFLQNMPGEEFLVFYGLWLLALWVTVLILRSKGLDTALLTVSAIASFEIPGIIRYFVGSAHGMHKWGFMFIMMVAGTLAFILRAHHFDNMGGGGWSSGCSSCSSSGGGGCGSGCGGGGCGGCGGS